MLRSNNNGVFLGPLSGYLLIFFLLLFFSSHALCQDIRYDVPIGHSPWLGPEDAPVTVVEFLDFQ